MPFGVEAFYWWNGSIGYTGGFAAMLTLFGLMADSMHKRRISRKRMAGIIILEIVIAGGMYPMALLTAVMLVFMLIDALVDRRYPKVLKIQSAVMCAVFAPAFAISIAAPGNARRQALFNKTPFLKAIYYSYIDALEYMWEEGMNAVTVIAVILLFVYMLFRHRESTFAFRCPLMFTAVTFSMVAVLWMPTIYAIGYVSGGRYYNILTWGTVMFWAANAIYYAGWLRRVYERCDESVHNMLRQLYPAAVGLVGMCCLIYGMLFIDVDEDLQDVTTLSAFKSLVYGEAAAYDQEIKEREELYNDPDITVVAVEPLTYYPELLYWGTLTTDPDDSRNQAMSSYYDKEYMYEIDYSEEDDEDSEDD